MEIEEDEEVEIILSCHICFVNEVIKRVKGKSYHAILHTCEYCKAHTTVGIDKKLTLERQLSIMHKTNLDRFPNIIRLMYEVLDGN